jgi:hypothetical protein
MARISRNSGRGFTAKTPSTPSQAKKIFATKGRKDHKERHPRGPSFCSRVRQNAVFAGAISKQRGEECSRKGSGDAKPERKPEVFAARIGRDDRIIDDRTIAARRERYARWRLSQFTLLFVF